MILLSMFQTFFLTFFKYLFYFDYSFEIIYILVVHFSNVYVIFYFILVENVLNILLTLGDKK